ncbi:Ulp1 protease family, carboxy-terminal domain protein [Arachis hypogaea]|nr:Ulp1 protease family, carboxy-terminal domain protein [Arachis hypogaea]
MEEYRPLPADDSQEPQTDDAVVPALSPTSVLKVHSVEDNNNLNLELMIQGSVDQFVHKDSIDDAVDVVDKASIQKNHEVRTAVMEDNMQCFEKRLLNIEKNFTDLHNNLPHLKGGAETFTSGICRTNTQGMRNSSEAQLTGPKLYSNTDECLAGEIPMPADKKIRETTALKSHDKGKSIAGECLVGMFDIIVPNSPGYDDDVIIDEQRSTPRPNSRVANSKPPLARKLHWSTGVPKVGISRTVARSSPVIRSTEMIMHSVTQLPSLTHMDCNTQVGELFSGSPCRTRPTKLSKMEPVDNDSVPHSAEISPYIPVLSMRGCVNNQVPLITQVGPLTSTYDMEFRPTPEMDVMYDEVRFVAYIFRKTNETNDYGEILFKFTQLEVSRGQLFSLCPRYVPHSDIVNITVMMASMKSSRALPPRKWFVPSTMANDILLLKPLEVIIKRYLERWMPEITQLEHVFVPICEASHSWYLMVIDVSNTRVYSLDVTKAPDTIERRERNMRTIVDRNAGSFQLVSPDPTTWGPIQYPQGVPTLDDSFQSATWMLYWLQLAGKFNLTDIGNMTMPDRVRMRTTINIVCFPINEVLKKVDLNSAAAWNTILHIIE